MKTLELLFVANTLEKFILWQMQYRPITVTESTLSALLCPYHLLDVK